MKKYQKPDDYGNLGFWSGAYAGILYSEWHLATGDKSVLKNLTALRDWAVNGQHPSAWDVPALGHGPERSCPTAKGPRRARLPPAGVRGARHALRDEIRHLGTADALHGNGLVRSEGPAATARSATTAPTRTPRNSGRAPDLFAMAAHLRGERPDMRDAMTGFMRARHPWIRNSHAYGEPGGALGPVRRSTSPRPRPIKSSATMHGGSRSPGNPATACVSPPPHGRALHGRGRPHQRHLRPRPPRPEKIPATHRQHPHRPVENPLIRRRIRNGAIPAGIPCSAALDLTSPVIHFAACVRF
jgi:hypothetical protein